MFTADRTQTADQLSVPYCFMTNDTSFLYKQ